MALNVIIRTPNHLGDCIMALPMISDAREAYAGAAITVLAPEALSGLFENNTSFDDLWTIPAQYVHGLIGMMKIKEIIAKRHFDVGYILPPSFGAAAAFQLAGVKERVGYVADGRRLLLTRPLALPIPLSSEHRSLLYFNLLRRGANVAIEYTPPRLHLNDADLTRIREVMDNFRIDQSRRFAVVAFRAVAESRRWGTDNYTALATLLTRQLGLQVVLIGSSDDQRTGDEIVKSIADDSVINLAGKTSIRELAALCSRAAVFVGNDSGPAHVAAAVGIPIVVLSGADNPQETSPMSDRKTVLYQSDLSCISCVKNVCPLKGADKMQCMMGISIESVYSAVASLTERNPTAGQV